MEAGNFWITFLGVFLSLLVIIVVIIGLAFSFFGIAKLLTMRDKTGVIIRSSRDKLSKTQQKICLIAKDVFFAILILIAVTAVSCVFMMAEKRETKELFFYYLISLYPYAIPFCYKCGKKVMAKYKENVIGLKRKMLELKRKS